MQPFAKADGVATVEPWDYRYYQEKVRKAKYNLSEDDKPYLEQSNLIKAMFWSAEQLYDLRCTENKANWQQDVRTFEVTNAMTGELIGLFYLDTYGREGKRSGAWATGYRDPSGLLGNRPKLVSNNNNFTKPEEGKPVLISLDDASTVYEFGHAIHALLTRGLLPVAQARSATSLNIRAR